MSQEDSTDLGPIVFPVRIILFALILGVAIYAGIAVFLVNFAGNGPMAPMNDLMTWVAIGFGVLMALLQAVVPGMVLAAARQRIAGMTEVAETASLLNGYRSHVIVGAALCEGGAFMALTAYLLEGNVWLLVLATALMVLIAMRFPSVNGLSEWLERQRRLVQGIRSP